MVQINQIRDRRTSVERIFDYLNDEINSMRLKPGDRISEAEIAAKFGVSRQPVRDAFTRLANHDLLLIRPQRATEVKKFSPRDVEKSRFVRAAVEAEILRRAARRCSVAGAALLDDCIAEQHEVLKQKDYKAFGALDYAFHEALCHVAEADYAFEVISMEKAKVDRLCTLSLSQEDRMPLLVEDHEAIVRAIKNGDPEAAVDAGMLHLSRLDATIAQVSKTNANYFENDLD